PNTAAANQLAELTEKPITREQNAFELLKRPEINYQNLIAINGVGPATDNLQAAEQIEIQAKYAGYIERQTLEIDRLRRYEEMPLPKNINYASISGLSTEVKQKLEAARPANIGIASRIPGLTPAAISLLLIHLKKHSYQKELV